MSEIAVMKFGGTSVANSDRVKKVAKRVVAQARTGKQVAVVVSAQGDATDKLIGLANDFNSTPSKREMDQLLATGEIVSAALMAMAIRSAGQDAISLTGFQAGFDTDANYGLSNILRIDADKIRGHLDRAGVTVICGFQGITADGEVTTLGRGGSDTSAVAVAAALGVKRCDIFTDVDGIYTADPRMVAHPRRLVDIDYEEMLELSGAGARVMDPRAVDMARRYDVEVHVRSSFDEGPGSIIRKEVRVETCAVRGIAFNKNIAKVTVLGVPHNPQSVHRLFQEISDRKISLDAIVQSESVKDTIGISFTLGRGALLECVKAVQKIAREIGAGEVLYEIDCAKVSMVGGGMKREPGVAARMFKALAERQIKIHMISTSEIKVSVVIDTDRVSDAVEAIHEEFQLSEAPVETEVEA